MIGLAVVLVGVLVGWRFGWTRWSARRRAALRQRELDDALAEVAELLLVVLGAGVGVAEGVVWLAERGPVVARPVFAGVLEQLDRGERLVVALSGVVDEAGSAYRPLVSALTAAVRDGVPLSSLLLRLGDEARASRRQARERTVRALPVQMLFPLVCCSLPAVVVGAVVPLVLVGLGRW